MDAIDLREFEQFSTCLHSEALSQVHNRAIGSNVFASHATSDLSPPNACVHLPDSFELFEQFELFEVCSLSFDDRRRLLLNLEFWQLTPHPNRTRELCTF